MLRRPWFWAVFAGGAALTALLCTRLFPAVFPAITLDIRMDRAQALADASALAERFAWGPADARQAASFRGDDELQVFVELEAGGKARWAELLAGSLYRPYTWQVRRFRPGETQETLVIFTPEGKPYGFSEYIPEDRPGPALEAEAARALAERAAAQDWGIDFSAYTLAEQAVEVRPSGRADHRLSYQRRAEQLGEGEYRLDLYVSGDRLTQLQHWVKVPESFNRRYAQMRSVNEAVAQVGSTGLYGLLAVGATLGLIYLTRLRAVRWRPALGFGIGIALLQLLAALNEWPLAWMSYDTATSPAAFVGNQLLGAAVSFATWAVLLSLTFAVAEGLTRAAFPEHVQLWKFWQRDVASSRRALGMTLAGYLALAPFFAYVIGFYLFSSAALGWWVPTRESESPDQLATYLPWLGAIATAARAGFWEESLCRALPIAGAALIGARFGRRRAFIVVAFALQALIFGAAHGNYPSQPGYARLFELLVPSVGFGLLYVYVGLPVGVILHYAYDVVWGALPLFAASSRTAWVDQLFAVSLCLLPLAVVCVARLRSGRWGEVAASALNRAWIPEPVFAAPLRETWRPRAQLARGVRAALALAGAAGLAAFAATTRQRTDVPPLTTSRPAVLERARAALAARGVPLDASWTELARVRAEKGDDDRFVWREGGAQTYERLLGTYLVAPYWHVRYARFEGDIVRRAEEYHVLVSGSGEVFRVIHQLPQGSPGARLAEAQARRLAQEALAVSFALNAGDLEEVLATPQREPARDDWSFEYRDRSAWTLATGEARAHVSIAGDEVTDVFRYVRVPEAWSRAESERGTWLSMLNFASYGSVGAALLFAAFGGIAAWARGAFSTRVFLGVSGALAVAHLLGLWNDWPSAVFAFETTRGFAMQVAQSLASSLFSGALLAGTMGLAAGYLQSATEPGAGSLRTRWPAAVALGCAFTGVVRLLRLARGPSLEPFWGVYDAADAQLALLGEMNAALLSYGFAAAIMLLLVNAIDRATQRWTRRRIATAVLIALGCAPLLGGLAGPGWAWQWIAGGAALGGCVLIAYGLVLRCDPALVPLAVATSFALGQLATAGVGSYPAARPGCMAAAAVLICAGAVCSAALRPAAASGAESSEAPEVSRGSVALP